MQMIQDTKFISIGFQIDQRLMMGILYVAFYEQIFTMALHIFFANNKNVRFRVTKKAILTNSGVISESGTSKAFK